MGDFFKAEIWWPLFTYLMLAVGNFGLGIILALSNRGPETWSWDRCLDWLRHLGLEGAGVILLALLASFRAEVWIAYGPALATAISAKTVDIIGKVKIILP